MESLEGNQKRLEDIYEYYNTNIEEIKENVEILKEWMKKQLHLPQKLPYDGFLEQMLKINKYRIERTKEQIDNYFTLKTLNLEIFQQLASNNLVLPLQNSMRFCKSPITLENDQNIVFIYVEFPESHLFDFDKYLLSIIAFSEYFLRYNNVVSTRIVIELKNFSLGQFKKFNLIKFRNILKLILNGYGFRIAGLDFLNLSVYCNPIMALIKSISSAKMMARIKIHNNLESLHKDISKDVLPEDLGGTAKYTLKKLADTTDLILENHRSFLADSVNYVSNEKLRVGKSNYDNMFGFDGTFKQLNID